MDERWLKETLAETRPEPVDGPHLGAEVIGALAQGRAGTDDGLAHLALCAECRDAYADLAALEPEPVVEGADARRPWWQPWAWVFAGATALGAAFLVVRPTDDGYQRRGDVTTVEPAVAVFHRASADALPADAPAGTKVPVGSLLGFRYGDPGGAHRTVTIVGWDGERVHWYYPEAEDQPAFAIESPSKNVRMPFDIALDDHQPGPLTVVVAWDTNPKVLAGRLRERARLPDGVEQIRLELVAP